MGSRGGGGGGLQQVVNPVPIVIPEPPTPTTPPEDIPHDITRADVPRLQAAMGQTGDEAGKRYGFGDRRSLYVGTSKAYNINAYLLSGGQTIHSPYSSWDTNFNPYTPRMVRNDIARIDAGMKPMSEAINTYRYVDGGALGKMLGDSRITDRTFSKLVNDVDRDPSKLQALNTALQNANYTHKAYTSTTYTRAHGSFDNRDIRMEMVVRRGTGAIVTNNHAEHEIVVHRDAQYHFKSARVERTSTGKKQLVITVEV